MNEEMRNARIDMIAKIEEILMKTDLPWSISYVPDDGDGSYQIYIGGIN